MVNSSDFPKGAIINAANCIERLETIYNFECEACSLNNCTDWIMLKYCFEDLADFINTIKESDNV